jgi:hypothetical protein
MFSLFFYSYTIKGLSSSAGRSLSCVLKFIVPKEQVSGSGTNVGFPFI